MNKHLFSILIMLFATKIYAQDQKPILQIREELLSNKSAFLRYDALTGYREDVDPIKREFGINFRAQIDTVNDLHYIKMYNLSMEDMLTHGLRKPSYVILEVKDPSRYRYDPKYGSEKEWLRKHGYCYELMMPKGTIKGMEIVDKHLEQLFNVKCSIQKRQVKAAILFRTSTAEKFKATGGEMVQDDEKGIYRNVSISTLAGPFFHHDILPFLDETGYKKLVNINLSINVKSITDLPALREALKRYDLDIKEETREIEMFVITELK